MHMKLVLPASLALAAALAAASVVPSAAAAASAAPAQATPAAWQAVSVPSSVTSPATLADVSAVSASRAWAVGADAETALNTGTPLILRWNGTKWAEVALSGVPGPGYLASVSAASASDAWAVGTDASGAVVLHWNGTIWRKVSFPDSSTATVSSVTAAPDGTAWLGGSTPSTGTSTNILVEQWNGKAWHVVKTGLGPGSLDSVRVTASGDVYFAGSDSEGGMAGYSHDGSWTVLPSAAIETYKINDVLGISPANVWAVGLNFNNEVGIYAAVVNHWNGTAWTTVNAPANVLSQDLSISPDNSGQPQWIGAEAGLDPSTTLYAYYNGSSWSSVNGATDVSGLFDANTVTAHIPGTNATWAVGGSVNNNSSGTIMPVSPIIEYNP
jgi:hypothetical protein